LFSIWFASKRKSRRCSWQKEIGLRGLIGIAVFLLLAWGLGRLWREENIPIPWRLVAAGLLLQLLLALLLLDVPWAGQAFLVLNRGVDALQAASDAGVTLVFGYLGGGQPPFATVHPENSFLLGFRALPMVLIISALSSLLFHLGILQRVVGAIAFVLTRAMGFSGALGLGAAAHIFLGMIEAPLLIRPYLAAMTRGEIFALMTVGMAGIAGTVMAVYAAILGPVLPGALGQIIAASIISTPGGLAVAALMMPFATDKDSAGNVTLDAGLPAANALEAILRGTRDGIIILVNIIATLIVVVALVSLADQALSLLPKVSGQPVSLQGLLSLLFRPVVWLMGIPAGQVAAASLLLATKTILNEFVAYLALAHQPVGALDIRSVRIMTYALCGFANFGSVGIMVGGMATMVPERRGEIAMLGLRSLVSGTIATCISGTLAGLLG
jgi:concentrative nucleoside transporter, CNT family